MELQKNQRHALAIRVLLSAFATTMIGRAAAAHVPIVPRDLAAEQAGDLSAAAGAIALLSIVIFFSIDKMLDVLVRQGRIAVGFWAGKFYAFITTLVLACVLWYVGVSLPCAAASARRTAAILAAEAHIDKPAHGGRVTAIGGNHLEAVLRSDRTVTLYIQGIAPTVAFPIKADALWAQVRQGGDAANTADSARIMLHPTPVTNEKAGESSVFIGEVPADLAQKPVDLTVTVPLGGSEHPADFRFAAPPAPTAMEPTIAGPAAPGGAGNASLPAPVHDTSATLIAAAPVTSEQRKLFLTPGGAYTAADIEANGGATPDQKWRGMMANHHLNAKKGALLCPVTMTQANPKFPWVVGGKKYLFCCPPCVAEFVKEAKEKPQSIKAPESYVQK